MESKLTALFALVLFAGLTAVGFLLRFGLGMDFSLQLYFQYLLLFVFAVLLLGRPFVKLGMDLLRVGYHGSEGHFQVPGGRLPPEESKPAPRQEGKAGAGRGQG